MNVHVAVPDLFWPDAARAHETRGDRLPALEALVAELQQRLEAAGA